MYTKLGITENSIRTIALFTNGFDKDYYVREVNRILEISPRTAQLILEDLEKKGIIVSEVRGKIKTYKLNMSEQTRRYLLLAEHYKTISFFNKQRLIKETIDKIKPYIKGIGIIFGSYAKGLEKKESDIDILVVGKCNEPEINRISGVYGKEISIKIYPPRIFSKNIRKDILLREVMESHIVFLGVEEFVNETFKER